MDWVLEKNFAKNFVLMTYDPPIRHGLQMNVVLDYLKKNPEVKAFASHNINFLIPSDPRFKLIPILFIRHPIDRGFSIYSYNRNVSSPRGLLSKKAKTLSLKEYIRWNLYEVKNRVMKDMQLWYLSNQSTKPRNEIFPMVLERIQSCSILGVVDRYDESMVVAEEFLKSFFEKIDLSYIKKHVSSNRAQNLSQRLESNRDEIGNKLMDDFIEKNSWDLKLYSCANDELDVRKRKIQDFETKLSNFQERCKKLAEQKRIDLKKGRRLFYSYEKKMLLEKKITPSPKKN